MKKEDNYIELPREQITFYGDTENEKKQNELLFDMGLQLSALDDELKEKDKEIDRLNDLIKISEKYLELIADLGYDYDGFSKSEDLKSLIDELIRYASLGRAYNTTECIYVNGNKKYNILHQELKEKNND